MANKFKFKDKVYKPPYSPYYDMYRGHVFVIDHFHRDDESLQHVWLKCITDSNLKVAGYVELHQLELNND